MDFRNRPIHRTRASRRVAAPFACRLVIMAKVARAGRVKTRLARKVGVGEALRFYRAASTALIERLSRAPFWETIVIVTPDADIASPTFPSHVRRMGQGGGDLGRRMQHPMHRLPPGPVCVIGTDIPGIEVAHLRRAFASLGNNEVVFGPAEDGGFWLVGQRRRPRVVELYRDVRWSHPETLADVLGALDPARVAIVERLGDVDEPADLARDRHLIGRRTRGFA